MTVDSDILIDATPLQSEHRLRGIGAYLRHLIQAIERGGEVRPWYLVSRFGREHVIGILPAERTVLIPRPHAPAQVYWMYNEILLRAALLGRRPSSFLATDFNGLVRNAFGATVAVLYDLTALKLSRRPDINRAPDLSTRLSDLRWRRYERKLIGAQRIVAISESAKRDAVALLGIPAERVSVVHLAVDHETFVPSIGHGMFAASSPYILHLGARNENKNQTRVLEAFARLASTHPRLELWFAGPWRADDLAWLVHENARLGLNGRAKHIGYVPVHDLTSLYGNALAFVFPSLEEGFGLPVLEAMASGAPVVTSNRSSLPEVAGDAAIQVDPTDVDALAHALHTVIDDPHARDALRERGYRWAHTFSWDRTAAQTIALLRRPPPRSPRHASRT